MTTQRLQPAGLAALPASIGRPAYDRSQPAGIVHLGLGAFHRAHQAVYFDTLMAQGETGWMIRGASLRSGDVANRLNPQGGLYTVVERSAAGECLRIAGSVRDVIVAPENPARLVAAMADPAVHLVTLTVTEKGYGLDPASGRLQTGDAAIARDLARAGPPRTMPGLIVAGLAARRRAGLPPFTVLSCDNLPENGPRTRAAIIGFARFLDPGLADWIEAEGAFPASMVDRIVPATTPADIAALEAATGYRDTGMVKTEAFSQWVVEDRFCARRPPLETVGVEMTDDVAGWERAKLRMLNGSHSALTYLGALAGYTHVHEAIAAPGFRAYVERLWDEAESVLDAPSGFDARAYRAALVERFSNPALHHALVQIAMDGSQKLPQRLLHTWRACRDAGRQAPAVELAIAAWMRWQTGEDENGRRFRVDDPLAEATMHAVSQGGPEVSGIVAAMLHLRSVFGTDLSGDSGLAARLSDALSGLMQDGAAAMVRRLAVP